ncbi:multicopy suppressor of a budding defect [Recurvomyces mirabilis]|uniref:Multicopy suppressor of a budding defect n=1 Tax=Recurvomyces mirabilis TaxID=574656 RepID=A0AAE0WIN3_9PEZI|nr:multicopy suppressor of a budding defect [Recurvomyces mirabilis]KAK5155811.1 multicopy suppressor of a budding defect [Recurvomyces mirabilis]
MPLFSRLKNKGAQPAAKSKGQTEATPAAAPVKPRYQATWNSKAVDPSEVEELVHACTREMKSRAEALNAPFMLLPFRPDTDPSGARTFVRNFYKSNSEGLSQYRGSNLAQELRLTEAIVLCSILKWCWSRIPGGVVSWPVYEGFQIGEKESNLARNAFDTFVPMCADTVSRRNIIFDFFDLLAAIAAHGKLNGLGGRKLSRLAGWWAFEHSDDGKGFEGGYKSWASAADASSHLFFAYLRSLSPDTDPSLTVIERIPRSLQALLAQTEYPPETPSLLQRSTPRVVMMVDSVSPTPFALLRRAAHFEYREDDRVLRAYSEFDDPVEGLTDECRRVLYAISSVNSAAAVSRHGNAIKTGQESWSAFQNMGFSDLDADALSKKSTSNVNGHAKPTEQGLRSQPRSRNDIDRPTTPSWADFMSSGFVDEDGGQTPTTLSLPHDKVLPLLGSRAPTPSGQSHAGDERLAPGEMAAITNVELDDAFWWVWMTSLSSEEPAGRKGVFGRCALIETTVMHGRWLIMEEQVKGASPDPTEGVFIAPKKSLFSFTKRGRNKRTKSDKAPPMPVEPSLNRMVSSTPSKSSLAPAQASKIKEAAAVLARNQSSQGSGDAQRRGRHDDTVSTKTNSMLTLGMMNDASPAMKWATAYDKKAIRAQYLGQEFPAKDSNDDLLSKRSSVNYLNDGASTAGQAAPALTAGTSVFPADNTHERDLPALPQEQEVAKQELPASTIEHQPPMQEISHAPEPELAPAATLDSPTVNITPAEAEVPAPTAEGIALPETTQTEYNDPLEKELAVEPPLPSPKIGRKPVGSSGNMPEHPAFRSKQTIDPTPEALPAVQTTTRAPESSQSPKSAAAIAAQRAMQAPSVTATVTSQDPAKLKKQGGAPGGFKKLFGRKKDNPSRQSMDVNGNNGNLALPSDANFGRRHSFMRRKPARNTAEVPRTAEPDSIKGSAMSSPSIQHDAGSMADVSHVDSRSDANADEEFSRFDQGPVHEMSSTSPQDAPVDYETLHAPAPQRHFNTQLADRIAPGARPDPAAREDRDESPAPAFVTPMEMPSHQLQHKDSIPQSETTLYDDADDDEEPTRTRTQHSASASETVPAVPDPEATQDRWAKIRENAARRAARASEEGQSREGTRPTMSTRATTEDGETSGEETIESRVARIKARVAELTGNIDGPQASRVHR